MSATEDFPPGQLLAIVSRQAVRSDEAASYEMLSPQGQADWTSDPHCATAFASMREATRMAFRLPANLRAYGLPRSVEMTLDRLH